MTFSISRRGGDFWWLLCDNCGHAVQILRWRPTYFFADRAEAIERAPSVARAAGFSPHSDGSVCRGCSKPKKLAS